MFANESKAGTKQLRACKSAFGSCRKYEDDVVTAMQACSKSLDQLKLKAKTLTANSAAVTAAQSKVASLTAARAARSCSAVLGSVSLLVLYINQVSYLDLIFGTQARKISN